ncbi:NifB/NifX family molybdenum-iron cluster-binding protein [Vulcanisaeta sp. JCM 16159]
MRVLIPVLDENGEQSRISPHFGRAPYLALWTLMRTVKY